ncbi:hypothetical protein LEMLEM_LOCUS5284, partial [Lemmus lemmus]
LTPDQQSLHLQGEKTGHPLQNPLGLFWDIQNCGTDKGRPGMPSLSLRIGGLPHSLAPTLGDWNVTRG